MTNNLLQACWDGDLTRVRELIAQKGPECVNWPTDNSKTTPLFYAVKSDSRNAAGVARILLGSGADVNYVSDVDERGVSPLLAALRGDGCQDIEVVRLLVAHGAAVNCREKSTGYAPLHHACNNGANEIVALLLDYGADVNQAANLGYTPLMCACSSGSADEALVAMLLGARGRVRRALHRGLGQGRRERDRGLPGHRAAGHRPHPARRVAAGVAPAVLEEVVEEGLLLLRRVWWLT